MYYTFDIETFPNCFLFSGKFLGFDQIYTYELSTRKNQRSELLAHLSYLQGQGDEMVGFNSLGFDYPVIHELLNNTYTFNYDTAYQKAQQIFNAQSNANFGYFKNPYIVKLQDRIIAQIDLFKINHFDNTAKTTSLKALQFAMRAESVEDMPIEHGTILTPEQMDELIKYNIHDVTETERFLKKCLHLIEMRKELLHTGDLSGDVLNFSDVKIGTEYLIKKIGRANCFHSGSKPKQTFREKIEIKDIIFPKIKFRTPEYQQVVEWYSKQIIYTKSDAPNPSLELNLAGLDFKFGVGGVHASVEKKVYRSDDRFVIKDIDVTGMYVNLAIVNNMAPEHLDGKFQPAYKSIRDDREKYPKKHHKNKTFKLAGNGAFGNSDNKFSFMFDPKYPKQTTINGQLQITQLAETLSKIPDSQLIQCNTDGITLIYPRELDHLFQMWKSEWMKDTLLNLEEVEYSQMFIRDVNNYLAIDIKGKVKRKGDYWYPESDEDYEGVWNKNFSKMVVQKCACQMLINNWKAEDLVRTCFDKFDFMLRYKTPGGAKVYIDDRIQPKTVRYYVSKSGGTMIKRSTPKAGNEIGQFKRKPKVEDKLFNDVMKEIGLNCWDERVHTKNKSKYEIGETSIEKGFKVKECNNAKDFDFSDVDYDYYIQEIEKLRIG